MKLPPDLVAAMNLAEGHLSLVIDGDQLTAQNRVVFLNEVAGRQHFLLEKDAGGTLVFSHSCPGRKTLEAMLPAQGISRSSRLCCELHYSGTGTRFVAHPEGQPQLRLECNGVLSKRSFSVQPDGSLVQLGDLNMEVPEAHIIEDGKEAYARSALDLWSKTSTTNLDLLAIAKSQGQQARLIAGLAISRLVTGFEVYCQRRFLELPGEGRPLDSTAVVREFDLGSLTLRQKNSVVKRRGYESGHHRLVDVGIQKKLINFQKYQDASRAFRFGYGISFHDLRGIAKHVTPLKECILFRHKLVHAKPDTVLFRERCGNLAEQELSVDLAQQKQTAIDELISCLHDATLARR